MTSVATTHDTIHQGRLTLEQPADGYRFGSDAMLLAAAVHAQPGQQVLELGCGVGAVLLAAQARLPEVRFTGIEREIVYADLAQANIERNAVADRIVIVVGDVTYKEVAKTLGTFDHVIANPPYYETGRHSGATAELRRIARQQEPDDLDEWLQAANRFLKPKGSVTFIHSVEKLDQMIAGLKKFAGAIRIFPLWPQEGQSSKRVIIHAIKGSRTPLSIMPGLVMHKGDGHNTHRALAIINGAQSLWEGE